MWPNPQETADFVTFTEEILNGKLHFLCSSFNSLLFMVLNFSCLFTSNFFCLPLLNKNYTRYIVFLPTTILYVLLFIIIVISFGCEFFHFDIGIYAFAKRLSHSGTSYPPASIADGLYWLETFRNTFPTSVGRKSKIFLLVHCS